MAKAIRMNFGSKRTEGFAILSEWGNKTASIKQATHDGDTISVRLKGNLSVRFLGIDTPETSFYLPYDQNRFLSTENEGWKLYAENPFVNKLQGHELDPFPIDAELKAYLQPKCKATTAENHKFHAEQAEDFLETQIEADALTLGWTKEDGKVDVDQVDFYFAFATEVMDGLGRLLCYVRPNQPAAAPENRLHDYNLRLLQSGMAMPYFVWPNVDPWRKQEVIFKAAFPPAEFYQNVAKEKSLQFARTAVQVARAQGLGVFGAEDGHEPLLWEPFELRYIARRLPPKRYVIDLANEGDKLITPEHYFKIPNPEDRLYIPIEYGPLFAKNGWKVPEV